MPKSNEFPPSGQGGDERSKWDSLAEDSQEEDLRDDESLTPEERLALSSKRLKELEDSTDPNAGDLIASERALRQKLLAEMMNNPANDEASVEANQEKVSAGIQSAEYYKEHPEEINNFVAELIKARGGEVKDGATWSKEQRAYVGDDGAPRDWAHLTGYLKQNPDEIGRFIDEYNQLTTAPEIDMSEATVEPAVAAGGGDINNIADQLDDNEIPDVVGWDDAFQYSAHRANGMEANEPDVEADESDVKKKPESIDDLRKMGYSQEQIDDWMSEGLDPLEEYKNASPAGKGDAEYQFRAHMENGMEGNFDSEAKKKPESIDDLRKMGYSQEQIDDWISEGLDPLEEYQTYSPAGGDEGDGEGQGENTEGQGENGEKNNDAFERGETEPNGDFGFWLKDKHGLTPSELNKLSPEEQKKILDEYAGEKGIETGDNNEGNNAGSGEDSGEESSSEQNENRENTEEANNEKSNGEKSLAFVSLCTEEEAKLAAHDIAEAMFAERVAHSKNPFKRIIMGNMMKEGVLAHYRKKALEAIVAYNAGENDGNKKYDNHTISQYWSKTGGIERFTKAYMEQVLPAIHQRAGESMQGYTTRTDENGEIYVVTKSRNEAGEIVETRVDADKNPGAKAAIDIRKAIEAYAGGTSDLASLKEQVRRIQQGEGMSDEKLDLSVDNLVELAEAAKQRAEHAGGILNVMDGFSYINGEAMRSVRSESHKTKIERASEWVSEHTMGLVSPEVVGTAASLMMFFADKGARTAARAVAPGIGGALIAGAAAGIRERGRVSGDIQTSSREAAMGKDVSGPEGRAGKYDRQVAETLYNMQSAEALTEGLNSAIESGDTDAMQKALANIEALVNISDSQKVDLIRYSSGENVENERMNMDVARAKAEVALRKAGVDLSNSEVYRDAINGVRKEISRDMSEKDKARSSLKTKRMLAQGAKTAAVSIAVGTAAREISAYFNPNQVGVLDHVFNKENNYDATNTPLASFLGLKEPDTTIPGQVFTSEVLKYDDQQLTQSQLNALGKAGYRIDSHDTFTSSTTTSQVDMGSFAKVHGINPIERNWLSNGTEASDGNELRAYYDSSHGWFTGMRGEGFGGGVTRDFQDDIANGRVHAFLSLTRGTQSTPIELSQRIFTAADGTQQIEFFSENADIQKILDAKQGLIEIASESGRVSESGLPIYDIWASWPGEDVSGTITDTVETNVKTTLYDVYETVTERGPDTVVEGAKRLIGGIGIFPFTSRKALHRAKPLPISRPPVNPPTPPTPPAPNPEPEPTPTPQPEPEPEPTPTPQPEPEPEPTPTPQPEPEPEPTPTPTPQPEPEPEPTPTPQPEPEPEPTPPNPVPTPPNPNNIGEQLEDNEIPDVPGWDEEYQFRAHRQNGMEENAENSENSENDPEKEAREAEINSLRERIASSRQRENENSNDEGVVASERSYRQILLARLRELTNGQDGQPEEETAEDAQREAEIRSLRERIASSRQRENDNSNDEGVVASERSYRQNLLARLRELTNGQEGEAEENEGAQPAPETGFRPDGGGEWTEANLKEIPNDDAFITSMLSNTLTGQQILAARNGNRIRFNRAMNTIRDRIDRINRSSLTPAQKVAIFNGGSIDGLNRQAREDIASLRADGILSESNS